MAGRLIIGLSVNLVVPVIGVIGFLLFCRRMSRTRTPSPPFLPWFMLFAIFGGWLMVALTILFWEWSGMASVGCIFLLMFAPIATAGMAWNLRQRRARSNFHNVAFMASVGYSAAMVLLNVLLWIRERH